MKDFSGIFQTGRHEFPDDDPVVAAEIVVEEGGFMVLPFRRIEFCNQLITPVATENLSLEFRVAINPLPDTIGIIARYAIVNLKLMTRFT